MVNSSGLFGLFALAELAAAFDRELWQLPSSRIADTATPALNRSPRCLLTLMEASSSPPLLSTAPMRSYKRPAPGDRPAESSDSSALRLRNPTSWRRRVCRHTR